MSRENVELVTRATEAVFRRPKPDFETVNALYHPEHVLVSAWATQFGEGERKGARGYRTWLEETRSAVNWTGEVDGALDLGPETVLVAATLTVEGASSGVGGEQRIWMVITVNEGKLTRTETYTDPGQALEAVGMSE